MNDERLGGRLPLLAPDGLQPAARALYDRLTTGRLGAASPFRSRSDTGSLIGPFNALLHAPAIGQGFLAFHEAEEAATSLSPREREVVILSVGAAWQSAYELYAHRAVASRIGLAGDVVGALAKGEPHPALSRQEAAMQRLTLDLARDRRISDEAFADCEKAIGREAVVSAVLLAAAYMGTCAILNAFAVPTPDAVGP